MDRAVFVVICIDVLMAYSFYAPLTAGDLSVLPIGTMALGAYGFGIATADGHSMAEGITIGVALALAGSFFGGLLMLRLAGFSSALASFGLTVIIQTFFDNFGPAGGSQGKFNVADATAGPYFWLITLLVAVAFLLMELSPTGRRIRAIRQDRLAAECIGVPSYRIRLSLYCASGLISGIGGIIYASYLSYINPALFGVSSISSYLTGTLLGGSTIAVGPLVGGYLAGAAPQWLSWLESYWLLTFSFILLVVIVVRRQGIITRDGLLAVLRAPQRLRERRHPHTVDMRTDDVSVAQHEFGRGIALRTEGVSKHFAGLQVLTDVSFEAPAGKITGIIGPNGAGKTTLLNVISGVSRPDRGTVFLAELPLRARSPHKAVRRGLARSFQNLRMFQDFTVLDNLKLAAGDHATYWLNFGGLADVANRRAHSLPFGRQRMIEIVRAFGTRPGVLLLDEPAAGLTSAEASVIEELLREIREIGIAIVVIEHNLGFVRRICDSVVVLDGGRKIADGPLDEVMNDEVVIRAYLGGAAPIDILGADS
jgi:branched-chain amino acid transport system permease protein